MKQLTPRHAAYAVNMAIACGIFYAIITQVLVPFVDRSDVLLGGMWAVVATTFVFRESRESTLSAALARLIATCVSFALCLAYLLIFQFSGFGIAVVIGVGTIVMILLGRQEDIVTTGITTAVVLVAAALSTQPAWHQRAPRRYRGRDRGWSSVQVACLLRLLSDHRRTHPMTDTARPSTNSWFGIRLLPGVLSLTAGSMDVIGFLGLGGLFTAHITGNLVIFAAHVVTGEAAQWAAILSVPVFMLVLCLARLSAGGFETIGHDSLRPLLLLQFLFLSGALIICVAAGPDIDPNAPIATVAGMLAVSAIAVQNALVQVSLHGVPATAVITTNIARFTTDVGTILLGARRDEVARERADRLWPSIAGFIIGCCVGAVCEARFGLRALALPAGLALLALATAAKSNALMVQKSGGAEPGHRASPLRRPRKIMIGRL
jgi:uncharacterized membrane protein YoaK (UPF0700 family)